MMVAQRYKLLVHCFLLSTLFEMLKLFTLLPPLTLFSLSTHFLLFEMLKLFTLFNNVVNIMYPPLKLYSAVRVASMPIYIVREGQNGNRVDD